MSSLALKRSRNDGSDSGRCPNASDDVCVLSFSRSNMLVCLERRSQRRTRKLTTPRRVLTRSGLAEVGRSGSLVL